MGGITDWRAAIADPRFWACYYTVDESIREEAFGLTYEQLEPYYLRLIGCDEHPDVLDIPEMRDAVEGSIIRLAFPQGFNWEIEIRTAGDEHTLFHPEYFPGGLMIARITPEPLAPALRWPELQAVVTSLTAHWEGDFTPEALLPLLFPIVGLTEADPIEDIRATLAEAWYELEVLRPSRLEFWLDHVVRPYAPDFAWIADPLAGWRASNDASPRHGGSAALRPFLEMLAE